MSNLSDQTQFIEKKYCTLYVVRHAQTVWNKEKRVQGHKDSPLTEDGVAQASALGKDLSKIHFDAVFTSDLLRARRTAEIATLEREIAHTTSELLREHAYGKYEGMKLHEIDELQAQLAAFKNMTARERFKTPMFKGAESRESMVSRFITFIREIAVGYAGKTVLVVSHGGILSAFLYHVGFSDRDNVRVANTGYFVMESDGVDFFIKKTSGIRIAE